MAKISGKDIDTGVAECILALLNGAQNVEDITSIETTPGNPNYEIGELVARRILDKRKELGGQFTDLSQLSDIRGFGQDKFEDLVAICTKRNEVPGDYTRLSEPLFRFASLRYHQSKTEDPALPKKNDADKSKTSNRAPKNDAPIKIQKRLSQTEVKDLERVHVAALAKKEVLFLQGLSQKLKGLYDVYIAERREAILSANEAYNKTIAQNIHEYESKLDKAALERLKELKQKTDLGASREQQAEFSYPDELFPPFEFQHPAFSDRKRLSKILNENEFHCLEKLGLLDTDYVTLETKVRDEIQEKRAIASYQGLQFSKNVLVKGAPHTIKNRYQNGYVLSLDTNTQTIWVSLVGNAEKQFINKANVSVSTEKGIIETSTVKLLDNQSRLMLLEIQFSEKLEIDPHGSFSYKVSLELDNGKQVEIDERVSALNDIWTGRYKGNWGNHQHDPINDGKDPIDLGLDTDDNVSGVIQMGWADLLRVEQTFCCYVPGEISHIENVMAREYKERSTEYLERSESTFVEEKETETNEKNDTTTTEKNDWSKEVQKASERSFNLNVGAEVAYGSKNGPWYAAINADMSLANSSSQSQNTAKSFSQEIIQNASESIRNKISEKRTTTLIKEFKEQNKHGFDNRSGTNHVSGVFRWLDKVYKNKIIKYGRGMLYEFMIPKPSEFYVKTLVEPDESPIEMPEAPEPLDINSWRDLTRDNYMAYINKYGINDFQEPKPEDQTHLFSVSELVYDKLGEDTTTVKNYNFQSEGLDDYLLTNIHAGSSYGIWYLNPPFHDTNAKFIAQINQTGSSNQRTLVSIPWTQMKTAAFAGRKYRFDNISALGLNYQGGFDVKIISRRVHTLQHINMHAEFKLKPAVFQAWQQATFQAIQNAYQNLVDDYNQAVLDAQAQIDADTDASLFDADQYKSPGAYQNIINTELKRLCIELLYQNVTTVATRCADFYHLTRCRDTEECEAVPTLTNLDLLDRYSSLVKFLEQSFHWSLSSYNLYPYFYASKCDWADMLHNEDTPDNVFQKFLKSGMARVMVPVREGFEEAVAYFMATGKPWFGEEPPKIDDDLFVSVVEELQEELGTQVGETWETNVPSTLTLLQAGSTYLDQQGLPCCKKDENKTGIGWSDQIMLEGKEDPAVPENSESGENSN